MSELFHPKSIVAGLLGLACLGSQAQSGPPGNGTPPAPPPEAVQACMGKAAGAQASFSGRDGQTFTGTCESQNGVLAVRPARRADGPPPTR